VPKSKNTSKGGRKGLKIAAIAVAALMVFLFCSLFIVVDDCASPGSFVRHRANDPAAASVPAVCEKVTLFKLIFKPFFMWDSY